MQTRIALGTALILAVIAPMGRAQRSGRVKTLPLSGLYRTFPAVPQFGAAVGQAYVFSARGEVYQGWTGTQAVTNFDFARARKSQPQQTGTYAVAGDKITFLWSNKTRETASFSLRRDPKTGRTNLAIGPSFGYKIVAWNQMLDGQFAPNTYQGGFADGPQRIVDPISFTRGGQFAVRDGAQIVLQGRYQVSGAALILLLADGTRQIHSLHVFEDRKNSPQTVLLDGRPFARQ